MASGVPAYVARILRSVFSTAERQGEGRKRTLFTSAWGGGGGPKWWVTSRNILSLGWQGVRSRSALHSWTIWNISRRETTFVINSRARRLTPVVTLAYLLPLTFPLIKLVLSPVACENSENKCSTGAPPKPYITRVSCARLCATPTPPPAQVCPPQEQHTCTPKASPSPPPCPPASTCTSCSTSANECSHKCTKSNCSASANSSCGAGECCSKKNGKAPINWCLEEDLSHKMLIKQANQLAVDSVTRLVTQTISAYQDYHEEYRRVMDLLMDALEGSRGAQGLCLELLDCKLLMLRAKVEDMKCAILELESYLYSVQKLAEAAAETAFLGHAEYASCAMSERIHSATAEMKNIKEESLKKERDMIELQTIIIVESGKSLK